MTASVSLSVLDLVPVRTDQTTADAFAATRSLARIADAAGLVRYWVAEHHNMPSVASTSPAVLIGMLAAATSRIRLGSGGVMLPNHAPFVIAEQFALLEAAYPGRIDLGIGRAPGSDPATGYALRHGSGITDAEVSRFPQNVEELIGMMQPGGVSLRLGERQFPLSATPKASSAPTVWLLGSSMFAAELAARDGLPYVFANHFAGDGTAEAIRLYRSQFTPSEFLDAPKTFLTLNAVVAETAEEARRLAAPQLLTMMRLRSGQPLGAQPSVEEAEADIAQLAAGQRQFMDAMADRWIIDTPDAAAERIRAMAADFDVDEVMINPSSGEFAGAAPDESPARENTVRLLAHALTPETVSA